MLYTVPTLTLLQKGELYGLNSSSVYQDRFFITGQIANHSDLARKTCITTARLLSLDNLRVHEDSLALCRFEGKDGRPFGYSLDSGLVAETELGVFVHS